MRRTTSGQGTLDVAVLGPVEAHRDEQPVAVRGPRQRALLGCLALRAGQVVSTDRLVEDLWGDEAPAGAATTLRAYVSYLRAAFEDSAVVVARKPGYVLALPDDAIDAFRFEAQAAEGRRLLQAGSLDAAAVRLRGALALWRGAVLTGCRMPPSLEGRVTQLGELRLAVLEDCIDADLALGRQAVVIGELEALVAEHPLRERLRELLMLALYRSGRQADALRAYQAARSLLAEELGLEPSRRLQELEAAILRQDASLEGRPTSRLTVRSSPTLVGRSTEMSILVEAVRGSAAGSGRAVLVSGEPGIGKTRLLDALAEELRAADVTVVRSRCDEAAGAPAFWPWLQVVRPLIDGDIRADTAGVASHVALLAPELRDVVGEVDALPEHEPDTARFMLFDAVTTVLARRGTRRPLVILMDDVQWADVPSLHLLSFVARRVRDLRVTVVATCRDTELAAEAALPDMDRVVLRGLSEADVTEFLGDLPASVASDVWRRTGGNPFFVGELAGVVRSGQSVLPEGVRAVIRHRLSKLEPSARSLLEVAAVVGRDFTLVDVQRAAGLARPDFVRALGAAVALGVVAPVEGSVASYRFQHDLLRESVYDAIGVHDRMAMHGRIADAIEEADRDGSRLREIASHLYHAAPLESPERAVEYLLRSADRATAALAYEDAALQTERALELLGSAGSDDLRVDVLLRLGDARRSAGQSDAARDVFREAADLARRRGSGPALALAALGYGAAGVTTGLVDGLLVWAMEEALALLGEGEDVAALRARVMARLAMELYYSTDVSRAAALADEAVLLARETGDGRALGESLAALHFCLRGPDDLVDRLAVGSELLSLAQTAGDAELTLRARHGRIADHLEVGDIKGFESERAAYAALADTLHQARYQGQAMSWRSLQLLLQGRLEEIEPVMQRGFELAQSGNVDAALQWFGVQLATLRREQLRHDEMLGGLHDFADRFPSTPAWQSALALFACEMGRPDEARAMVAKMAADDFEDITRDVNWLTAVSVLSVAVSMLGASDWARRLYSLLVAFEDRFVVVGGVSASACYGSVAYYLGLLASTFGDVDAAAGHFERAVAANESIDSAPWVAHTKAAFGALLLRSGSAERGTLLLDEAARAADAMGLALVARTVASVG
jgi:DNA-binding SARP family transcriptional activator